MDHAEIRPAKLTDAPAITPLLGQLGYPTNVETVCARFEHLLSDDRFACWVADSGGKLLGLATGHLSWHIELDYPAARLTALIVDQHARRQGLAQHLTARFEDWARENGARTASLNSGNKRKEAHAVYEKLGWSDTGRRFVKSLIM